MAEECTKYVTTEKAKEHCMDEETMALLSDTYEVGCNIRFRVFRRILRHMLRRIGTEPTIYLLMDLVKENRADKNVC